MFDLSSNLLGALIQYWWQWVLILCMVAIGVAYYLYRRTQT